MLDSRINLNVVRMDKQGFGAESAGGRAESVGVNM